MSLRCVCGREYESTNASPWQTMTIVDGKIVSGICIHGIYFGEKEEEDDKDN